MSTHLTHRRWGCENNLADPYRPPSHQRARYNIRHRRNMAGDILCVTSPICTSFAASLARNSLRYELSAARYMRSSTFLFCSKKNGRKGASQ